MTKNTSFTTSFGREIPFVEGYLESHSRNEWEDDDWTDDDSDSFVNSPMSYSSFRKDLVEHTVAQDFLQSIGVKMEWENGLEIGGREAVVARLLRGE